MFTQPPKLDCRGKPRIVPHFLIPLQVHLQLPPIRTLRQRDEWHWLTRRNANQPS